MQILGIDIGGTGMKGAIVDTKTGELMSDRLRIPTPKPATPDSVSNELKTLINSFEWDGSVGISFPTVIKNGKAMHYGNLDKSWQFTQVDDLFNSKTGNDFYVVNDADAAAMGVMEFGIGKNQMGLVITITLGTGIGSGVFFNGQLLSNFELGRMYGRKGDIMELVLWLILIAIGIFGMFAYVIKAVKFIKTDKIHDTAREKKLRKGQLEEEQDINNNE